MEYIYAALLLHKAGKDITEEAVISVLNAAGVNFNENRVKALIAALEGVDIEEAISKAAFSSAPVSSSSQNSQETVESSESVPEKKEEEPDHSEEDGMAGLGALFG